MANITINPPLEAKIDINIADIIRANAETYAYNKPFYIGDKSIELCIKILILIIIWEDRIIYELNCIICFKVININPKPPDFTILPDITSM